MWKSIGYESDSSSSDDDNNGNAPANNTQAATAQTLEPMQTNQDIDAKICEATNELKVNGRLISSYYLSSMFTEFVILGRRKKVGGKVFERFWWNFAGSWF